MGKRHHIDADTIITDRFLEAISSSDSIEDERQDMSFLRWLITNTALNSDAILLKLDRFIKNMSLTSTHSLIGLYPNVVSKQFLKSLEKEEKLQDFEDFLNIMGVSCKLKLLELPEGDYQLYFKHDKLISFFDNASSGTLALTNLYRRFENKQSNSFIYIDEFDAFYHYEMSEKVIRYFKKKFINSQVIFTTHNTNLMNNKIMRPDCLFILSRNGCLTPLNSATNRELREGHNLEKMYISGEFNQYE